MSTTLSRLLVITVSTRPQRLGPTITRWLLEAISEVSAEVRLELDHVDLAELALPFLDEPEHPSSGRYTRAHTRAWSQRVGDADAVLVVTPEYNHAMPATLKNALDLLSREWAWKPIGFVSYGNTSAGTRAVAMARQVASTLRLVPTSGTVALRIADEVVDGVLRPDPRRDAAAVELVRELDRLSRTLRPLRRVRAADEPVPPAGLVLLDADERDADQLLVLQRACWVQEAIANDTLAIPALQESPDDVREWLRAWDVWALYDGGRLVGAVRARLHEGDWHIGRLMVAPDHAGRGLGRWLLALAESRAPATASRIVLFTGAASTRNLALYHRAGYRDAAEQGDPDVVRLTKPVFDIT